MKPIPHKLATAKVTIDGLAICSFNQLRTWQATFLREPSHTLSLAIDGRNVNISGAREIEIRTVEGNGDTYTADYPYGCFYDPTDLRKEENMRWAINLNNPSDVGEPLTLKQPTSFGTTRLTITDALFYVSKLFPTDLYRVPYGINPNPPSDPEQYRFGRTSDELAADVFCKPGGQVIVSIDGTPERPLYETSKPHCIDFLNMDAKGPTAGPLEEGDFAFYYEACQPATQRYSFWGLPKTGFASSSRNRHLMSHRTDCNTTWTGPLT